MSGAPSTGISAAVNRSLRRVLVARLRAVNEAGAALMIVEHDMGFVADLCERVYVLDKGEVLTSCEPSELASDPRVVEAYLGTRKHRPGAAAILPAVQREPGNVAS